MVLMSEYPQGTHVMPSRRGGGHFAPFACGSGKRGINPAMYTLLWIVSAVLVIAGILGVVRGAITWGIVLIVLGLLVGPGGVSIFG